MNRVPWNFLLTYEEGKNVFIEAIKELFEYIKTEYFTIDYGEYSNLGISGANMGGVSVEFIIIFGMLGMVVACFMGAFNKGTLGGFIRTLLRNDCLSPESAKTLGELGYLKNTAVRSSLKNGYLKKFVHCVEDDQGVLKSSENKEGTVLFNDAHFYIPEADKYKVEVRFEGKKTHPFTYVIMIVAAIAITVFLIGILPDILAVLDGLAGAMKSDPGILT
jgi:hypothetical protein